MPEMIGESEFRKQIQETFDQIERAFEDVDPDVAECEQAMGSMTVTLADGTRCILSTQPSVRQLWLALAAKGLAFHFNLIAGAPACWMDDKGKGIELLGLLEQVLTEAIGKPLRIKA